MSKEKIILIDGNSIINRAFYALPPLTNKNGDYTNGVYGFFSIIFKFIGEEHPTHIATAFDLHAPTFRHKAYTEYKAGRRPMPEELRPQFPLLKEILKKMNIAVCEKEGYEADDILATLAKRCEAEGIAPVIITGDRDLLQAATDTTEIRIPKTKSFGTEVENYFAKDVFAKYGVTPTEFIEVKALMGDASDNVPGVPSIGEKTAIKIISEYKTVENAIENADSVKPKKASANLKEFKDQALMSKFLVTIDTDVPLDVTPADLKINDMFNNNAREAFVYNGFNSLLSHFKAPEASENRPKAEIISTREEAEALLPSLTEGTAYKLITEGKTLCGCGFLTPESKLSIVLVDTDISLLGSDFSEDDFVEIFKSFFEAENKKITYDGKSDITFFKDKIDLRGIAFDTMLAAYLLDPSASSYDYSRIANQYLGENFPSIEEVTGKGKSRTPFYSLEREKLAELFSSFVYTIGASREILEEKLAEQNMTDLYYNIELPLIYVLADMEHIGMKVQKEELQDFAKRLDRTIAELADEIYFLAGEEFNINSPKQLGSILFEKLKLKGGKKTKTGYSTSADVLEKLRYQDEIIDKILSYRTYTKLKSTYCDGLLALIDPKTSKVYSTFNQTVTATGRISSTEPNLQNIPIKLELGHLLRKAFVPTSEEYCFADGDYSQIELRVLAHLSGDETMINAFKNGEDIHRLTASQAFRIPLEEVTHEQRQNAKAVNFGIVYGISAYSLSQDLHITRAEAQRYIDGYFERYPKVKIFLEECVEKAKKSGVSVTLFGRIRPIPELSSTNANLRAFGERAAMNAPVQGTAADIIKIAMIKIHQRLKKEGLKSRLILQVHDELLIEAYKPELDYVMKILKEEMENAADLALPLSVDLSSGENWYEVK
ncbi:MAG: DNA polymerase I [Clostridiales bacterium]|nr:DNA polymerase I [Clostridiales bacterium]